MKFPVETVVAALLLSGLAVAMPADAPLAGADQNQTLACAASLDAGAADEAPLCSEQNSSRFAQKFAQR